MRETRSCKASPPPPVPSSLSFVRLDSSRQSFRVACRTPPVQCGGLNRSWPTPYSPLHSTYVHLTRYDDPACAWLRACRWRKCGSGSRRRTGWSRKRRRPRCRRNRSGIVWTPSSPSSRIIWTLRTGRSTCFSARWVAFDSFFFFFDIYLGNLKKIIGTIRKDFLFYAINHSFKKFFVRIGGSYR